jgi:hypothetical protein
LLNRPRKTLDPSFSDRCHVNLCIAVRCCTQRLRANYVKDFLAVHAFFCDSSGSAVNTSYFAYVGAQLQRACSWFAGKSFPPFISDWLSQLLRRHGLGVRPSTNRISVHLWSGIIKASRVEGIGPSCSGSVNFGRSGTPLDHPPPADISRPTPSS